MASNSTSNPTVSFTQISGYAKGSLVVVPYGYRQDNNVFAGPINFLLNPETITESLAGGWIHKSVPGQNDPVSSWVGNGVRTVGVTLLLIKDVSTYNSNTAKQNSVANPYGQSILGAIGAAVAKIPLNIYQNLNPTEPATASGPMLSIDIATELDQLRQLRYGELSKGGLYSTPPSLVKFQFSDVSGNANTVNNPTLGVTSVSAGGKNLGPLGNVYWTVDTIDINVTKWSSSLQPLQAEVKLTLVQFNDINRSRTAIG